MKVPMLIYYLGARLCMSFINSKGDFRWQDLGENWDYKETTDILERYEARHASLSFEALVGVRM